MCRAHALFGMLLHTAPWIDQYLKHDQTSLSSTCCAWTSLACYFLQAPAVSVTCLPFPLQISPLVSDLALYDIVGTPGVAADISHINSRAVTKVTDVLRVMSAQL
jgi:hypothetical protein